jgi:Fe-S-cluster-containing hydrogenase component 2
MSKLIEQCDIVRLKEVDTRDLVNYDLIGLGSPVWGGVPPNVELFINTMPPLQKKHSFAFSTHGAKPDRYFPSMVRLLVKRGLIVIGTHDWYGSVSIPQLPKPYFTDGHPDEIDLKEAENFGKEMVELSRRIFAGNTKLIPPLPSPPPPRTFRLSLPQPKLNTLKCCYPECRLCMDHCPMNGIDLSVSPLIFSKNCRRCYFCEMICPEGAIEVNYESDIKKVLKHAKELARVLDKAEAKGCFRRLVPNEDIGWNTPYYKVHSKHPRYVILKENYASEP